MRETTTRCLTCSLNEQKPGRLIVQGGGDSGWVGGVGGGGCVVGGGWGHVIGGPVFRIGPIDGTIPRSRRSEWQEVGKKREGKMEWISRRKKQRMEDV